MDDLQQALTYLSGDKLRYMDMLEPLRRGSVDTLYAWTDGVLLHETGSGGWFSAADGAPALDRMLRLLPAGTDLFTGHEPEYRTRAAEYLGLHDGHTCYQSAWLGEEPPRLPEGSPPLVRLGDEWAEFVHKHYSHSFADVDYMREAIGRGMLGVFADGALAGFVGSHDEGTIGMLEVLPEYRRRGLGEVLTIGAVCFALSEGRCAFAQVVEGNAPSFALQHKVGMTVCEKPMYWLF